MNNQIPLVCPSDHCELVLGADYLKCPVCSNEYPIRDGIPRFLTISEDPGQAQVQEAFRFKWTRDDWGYKPEQIALTEEFFRRRFGFASESDVETFRGAGRPPCRNRKWTDRTALPALR